MEQKTFVQCGFQEETKLPHHDPLYDGLDPVSRGVFKDWHEADDWDNIDIKDMNLFSAVNLFAYAKWAQTKVPKHPSTVHAWKLLDRYTRKAVEQGDIVLVEQQANT